MERSKWIARNFFDELGFSVTPIPTADQKRADLAVNDGDQEYVVEVKEKVDTGSQLTAAVLTELGPGRQITHEPYAPSNLLDGILKQGRKQLAATPSGGDALRLLFVLFTGPNASMFVHRTLYTFYGVQDILPPHGQGEGLNCVYFHNSFSFSSPGVDGLLVAEHKNLQLCLNEFSPRCDALRQSRLGAKMRGAVYDPATFGTDAGKVVLRSSISRTNEADVLDELERMTGIRYRTITLNRYNL